MAIKHGTAGADTLVGTSIDDQLFGEAGNDVLKGLFGRDTLDGGKGRDTADFGAAGDKVEVDLDVGLPFGLGIGGEAEGDHYVGIENVVGSSFGDRLFGDPLANRLEGGLGGDILGSGGGNDTLLGGGGNDVLVSGAAADLLNGGSGTGDTLDYESSVLGVNVNLSNGQVSGGDAAGDTISGFEKLFGSAGGDVLAGSLGANALAGSDGADRLAGFAGNDTLTGGTGADTMTGGDGTDTFSYASFARANESPTGFFVRDVINDFSHAQGDVIDLHLLDASPSNPAIDAFEFLGKGPTIDAPGQIEYVFENNTTVVRINTEGSNAPEMEIQLQGTIDLVASDFLL
jgi:Ca2+-binding RTX toxin-like protein